MATVTLKTAFNLAASPKVFAFTDLTDYAGQGISTSNVNGCIKILSPGGFPYYNNVDFTNGGCDIHIAASVNNQIPINLPLVGGVVQPGDYVITYTVRDTNAGVDYVHTYTFTYNYESPVVAISQQSDLISPLFTSQDITNYTKAGATLTLTRTHKLFFPEGTAGAGSPITSAALTITTATFYPGTQTTTISSVLQYVFADGLVINDTVTGKQEYLVVYNDICVIACCLMTFEDNMRGWATSNRVKYEENLPDFILANAYAALLRFSIQCGKNTKVNTYLDQIRLYAHCTEACTCTDPTGPIIGIGGGGATVVQSGGEPVEVEVEVAGSTTTYTVTLSDEFVARVNSSITSIAVNAIFVDAVNGDDATGARYDLTKPFKSINAANAVSDAGTKDVLWMWPGTYTDNIVAKDGIRYHFEHGAILNSTTCFSDGGQNVIFSVTGDGEFNGDSSVIHTTGANHTINFNCLSATSANRTVFADTGSAISNITFNCKGDISSLGAASDGVFRIYAPAGYLTANIGGKIIGDSGLIVTSATVDSTYKINVNAAGGWYYNLNGYGYIGIGVAGCPQMNLRGDIYITGNGTAGFPAINIVANTLSGIPLLNIYGNIYATNNSDGLFQAVNGSGGVPLINFRGKIYSQGRIANVGGIVHFYDNVSNNAATYPAISHAGTGGKTIVHSLVKNLWNDVQGHGISAQSSGLIIKQSAAIYVTGAANSVYTPTSATIKSYKGSQANTAVSGGITQQVDAIAVNSNVDPE